MMFKNDGTKTSSKPKIEAQDTSCIKRNNCSISVLKYKCQQKIGNIHLQKKVNSHKLSYLPLLSIFRSYLSDQDILLSDFLCIQLLKIIKMGNQCCHKDLQSKNTDFTTDEFYDPYTQFRSKLILDPSIIEKHGPRYLKPLTELPRQLIKLQTRVNQAIQPPKIEYYQDAFMLPPFQLYKDCFYFGQWSQGQKHGYGKLYFPDKSAYSGQFSFGRANGNGRLFHPNGDIYIGEWKNDQAHGFGKYISVNKVVFEGYWQNDQRNGNGKQTWPDGTIFEGLFLHNKKNGKGKFRWVNGDQFIGEFKQNKRSGQGVMRFADGRQYKGGWVDDQMHGEGQFIWPSGKSYKGFYEKDLKHGLGRMIYQDGSSYNGYWSEGKQHGKGQFIDKSGEKKVGYWQNGVIVSKI